jgi:hypothetical protein
MAETNGVPKGECKQCWPHSKMHRSFIGIGEKPCAPCESHMYGCPENMIQQ